MKTYAKSEWQRAQRSLAAAKKLIDVDPDSAASRAYYAAFHAVTAAFALHEKSFRKHTALRAAVHRDLVNAGVWSKDLGADFDFLMNLRDIGDYGGIEQVNTESVTLAVQAAERILDAVKPTLTSET